MTASHGQTIKQTQGFPRPVNQLPCETNYTSFRQNLINWLVSQEKMLGQCTSKRYFSNCKVGQRTPSRQLANYEAQVRFCTQLGGEKNPRVGLKVGSGRLIQKLDTPGGGFHSPTMIWIMPHDTCSCAKQETLKNLVNYFVHEN